MGFFYALTILIIVFILNKKQIKKMRIDKIYMLIISVCFLIFMWVDISSQDEVNGRLDKLENKISVSEHPLKVSKRTRMLPVVLL